MCYNTIMEKRQAEEKSVCLFSISFYFLTHIATGAESSAPEKWRKNIMLRSCSYCGKIHEKKMVCLQKSAAIKKRQRKASDEENKFRWSGAWKAKANEIKQRDLFLCQVCLRQQDKKFNPHELSVHHIRKLRDAWEKRLENDNLITLCRMHHEEAESGILSIDYLLAVAAEQEEKN